MCWGGQAGCCEPSTAPGAQGAAGCNPGDDSANGCNPGDATRARAGVESRAR